MQRLLLQQPELCKYVDIERVHAHASMVKATRQAMLLAGREHRLTPSPPTVCTSLHRYPSQPREQSGCGRSAPLGPAGARS